MTASTLTQFLDTHGVDYECIEHAPAFTASEAAASAHVPGRDFAKTVIVRIGGRMAMVVLPADRKIVLSDLRALLERHDVELATEDEFRSRFPDCEIGAMPPFGNLYGLPVYLAQSLAEESAIAFNACTHRDVIRMAFADYAELVKPEIVDFVTA